MPKIVTRGWTESSAADRYRQSYEPLYVVITVTPELQEWMKALKKSFDSARALFPTLSEVMVGADKFAGNFKITLFPDWRGPKEDLDEVQYNLDENSMAGVPDGIEDCSEPFELESDFLWLRIDDDGVSWVSLVDDVTKHFSYCIYWELFE